MGVTALFGGTFDPPHAGHRRAVAGLFATVPGGCDRVVVIPSPNPPHKPTHAPTEHRVEMVRRAFAPGPDLPGPVEVSLCEIERARRRPGPTFTYDTLLELRPRYGELAFVIGTDQLDQLPRWHRFPEILALCDWIVLERKPVAPPRPPGWEMPPGRRLLRLPTEAPELSSTRIRERLALGHALPSDAIPAAAMDYLLAEGLYGTTPRK